MDRNYASGKESKVSRGREIHHPDAGQQSDVSQEEEMEEDRKPPTLPASVVAVHLRSQRHGYLTDDNRSISSQKSESGYYSSGALSDGPPDRPIVAYPAAPLTSVGSVGSHGSAGCRYQNDAMYAFAVSSYAASEAAKSDIATVCSGSVIEDIEVSSVEMNVPQNPNNVVPSPLSERVVTVAGSGFRRSVEFAPSSFPPLHKQYMLRRSGTPPPSTDHPLGLNDMGPPLSRALLMQSLHSTAGSSSRPGSVKSFGSNGASQNSDVVAHVDTDDCGGSLVESVTDGQSVHSQEDIRSGPESESIPAAKEEMDISKEREDEPMNGTHPLLKNGSSTGHPNGRTSPGGTIYKGKGVRRYQGRYMNLPLKRFYQDSSSDIPDTVLEADKVMEENKNRAPEQRNGRDYESDEWCGRGRTPSPRRNGRIYSSPERRNRLRDRSPTPGRTTNGYHNGSNGYHNGSNGYHKNGYHKNGHKNGYHNNGYKNSSNGYKARGNHSKSRSRSRSRSASPDNRRKSRRRWNTGSSSNNRGDSNSPSRNRRARNNGRQSSSRDGHSPRRRSGKRQSSSRSHSQSRGHSSDR